MILGIYALLWQQVIKKFELSVAYANKAVTLLWALIWGIFIFHEKITVFKTAGDSAGYGRDFYFEQRGGKVMNFYLLILIVSVIIASFAQILLKKSAEKTYASPVREYLNFYVICGYGMMFLSMFLTVFAYRGMDFSNVPVVESLGYVVVMVLSYFFFKEKITKRKLLGMAVILLGIFVYYR